MWATPRRVSVTLSIDNGGNMKITTAISVWLMTRAARRGERGATVVEYGLLIAGVAVVLIFTIDALMDGMGGAFDRTVDGIDD
jgi:Flp pilus assembly pilin Flp